MQPDHQTFSSLLELVEVLSHQNNFQEILRLVSDRALEIFKADFASVVMINPRTQKTVKTVIRKTKRDPLKGLSIIQTNVIGWMMVNRNLSSVRTILPQIRDLPKRFSKTHRLVRSWPSRSALAASALATW